MVLEHDHEILTSLLSPQQSKRARVQVNLHYIFIFRDGLYNHDKDILTQISMLLGFKWESFSKF